MGRDSFRGLSETNRRFVGALKDHQSEHGEGADRYILASLGSALGLVKFGVNHETIFPGGQSSLPHAHSEDDEFVFVLEGNPSLWMDGELSELSPGDAVAFPAGTGIAHCFLNNSDAPFMLLIVGENSPTDRVVYPMNPRARHPRPWTDAPTRPLGPHDGCPDEPPASG